MLDKLLGLITDGVISDLVASPGTEWNSFKIHSLKVRYETPHVDRLWIQLDEEHRLMFHRIYPCDKPFLHSHPWPSAVYIVSGRYLMEICSDVSGTLATSLLTKGSGYEMLDPKGRHSVKPIATPSLSLMLIGKPWGQDDGDRPGKGLIHEPMTADEQKSFLDEFKFKLSTM